MAITFPTDPGAQSPVNTFSPSSTPVANSANGNTYVWNGTAWTTQQANLEQYVNVAGDVMTGTLTVPTVDATTVDATTLNAGNIVLPDNGGITFGTSYGDPGAQSRTLDDYEEGVWTPVITQGASSGSGINCNYVKIGRLCWVTGRIYNLISPTAGGIVVEGLPFTPYTATTWEATGSVMMDDFTFATTPIQVTPYVSNAGWVYLYRSISGGGWSQVLGTEMGTTGSYIFSLCYPTV